jgi:hypothetical protein
MRPFGLEITAGYFAFAAGHLRIAIRLLAGTLNSSAAFSIAACESGTGINSSKHSIGRSHSTKKQGQPFYLLNQRPFLDVTGSLWHSISARAHSC